MKFVGQLENLETLDLLLSPVTDDGLRHLRGLKSSSESSLAVPKSPTPALHIWRASQASSRLAWMGRP